MLCAIWYHLYNLKNVKNAHEGPGTLLEVSLLHGCFSRFLNCTNDTKLHKAEKLGNLLAFQICHALNLVYKKKLKFSWHRWVVQQFLYHSMVWFKGTLMQI